MIEKTVELGSMGCDLEDSKVDGETVLICAEDHVSRVRLAIDIVAKAGVQGVCYW